MPGWQTGLRLALNSRTLALALAGWLQSCSALLDEDLDLPYPPAMVQSYLLLLDLAGCHAAGRL
jgi:hypothetical protein